MAFTGRLGTSQSQLGQIELGSLGVTTVSASFTADAFIQLYFRADAVIKRGQTASFTADAAIATAPLTSFTANAVVFSAQIASFTADAVLASSFSPWRRDRNISGYGIYRRPRPQVIQRRRRRIGLIAPTTRSASFTVNSYINPPFRQQHARTGPHVGTDKDLSHTIAWSFERYLRGESLQEVLVDIDARLTAREGGFLAQRRLLTSNAIAKAAMAKSLLTDSFIVFQTTTSFTANALVAQFFRMNAVRRASQLASLLADAVIGDRFFRGDAFIRDPAVYINDSIAGAPDWNIGTRKSAAISTASLSHEAGDPTFWFFTQDKTGWAKFTLGGTTTVRLDTVGSQGNMQIDLFGPGASPTNGNGIVFQDDNVVDPTNPYGLSERIEMSLDAGTYFVAVALLDYADPDANVQLNMEVV